MPAYEGPVDNVIRKLVEFVAAHRASAYSAWTDGEHQEFRRLIKELEIFVFKVGYFATASEQAVEAAYDGAISDLRSRLGKLSWLMSMPWIMKTISRGRSMSGWVFQELRERIRTITTSGPLSGTSRFSERETMRRLDEVAPALVPLRRVHRACEIDGHKRNRQLERQGFCERGCDLLLLQHLKFPPVLIGRVLGGLKEGTTRNRLIACESNLRTVQKRLSLVGSKNTVASARP